MKFITMIKNNSKLPSPLGEGQGEGIKKALWIIAIALCATTWYLVFSRSADFHSTITQYSPTKEFRQMEKILFANDTLAYVFSDYDKLLELKMPKMEIKTAIKTQNFSFSDISSYSFNGEVLFMTLSKPENISGWAWLNIKTNEFVNRNFQLDSAYKNLICSFWDNKENAFALVLEKKEGYVLQYIKLPNAEVYKEKNFSKPCNVGYCKLLQFSMIQNQLYAINYEGKLLKLNENEKTNLFEWAFIATDTTYKRFLLPGQRLDYWNRPDGMYFPDHIMPLSLPYSIHKNISYGLDLSKCYYRANKQNKLIPAVYWFLGEDAQVFYLNLNLDLDLDLDLDSSYIMFKTIQDNTMQPDTPLGTDFSLVEGGGDEDAKLHFDEIWNKELLFVSGKQLIACEPGLGRYVQINLGSDHKTSFSDRFTKQLKQTFIDNEPHSITQKIALVFVLFFLILLVLLKQLPRVKKSTPNLNIKKALVAYIFIAILVIIDLIK